MSGPVLAVEGLEKHYPGTVALDGVSLEVRAHEVVGLVGENGAGKSTLLKVLAGLTRADGGAMRLRGEEVRFGGLSEAAEAGIGMVFQEQSLVPNVTVAENLFLGVEGDSVQGGVYRWRELRQRAEVLLAKVGGGIDPRARTEDLSFGQRQMVEIAKVLAIEERIEREPVILLDEPTSVLAGDELETLFAQIERLRDRASVVFVSHRLDEVLRVSDRVYVMRDGRCVAERVPADCDEAELHGLMVGEELDGGYYRQDAQQAHRDVVVLAARGLGLADRYRDVDLELHAGEVLGVTGVEGSGRDALCRTLFGIEAPTSGRIELDGRPVRFRSPAEAVAAGIGYVPSERRVEGAALGLSVADNMILAHRRRLRRGPFVDRSREAGVVAEWSRRLRVKTPSPSTALGDLSGGNQQKVVLAKWLLSDELRVLVLDHPTRGLDVGAKAELYELIRGLAADGIAVLLTADTLEETIALSHNVLVLRDGVVSGRLPAPPDAKPTQVELVERMV